MVESTNTDVPADEPSALRGAQSVSLAELEAAHPADAADVIENLAPSEAAEVLACLSAEVAAHTFEEMEDPEAQAIASELPPDSVAGAVAEMALDDAADLLGGLDDSHQREILAELDDGHRAELEALMAYPPESAGGVMSPEVVALSANLTALEAVAELRRQAQESEQIYYTYVVDHQYRLVGVLSLRDLILAPEEQPLSEIMITDLVTVDALMDREEVADVLAHYGYYAVPVVDDGGHLLGIVTVDDVVEILRDEATEDMQRMVGAGADERADSPLGLAVRRRLPWLVVNLGTAFLAAAVIQQFESQLATLTALAVLMSVVAGQAGNAGAQSMAVVIRGIATGELRAGKMRALVIHNLLIGLMTGLATGIIGAVATYWWWGDPGLALVLGLAILLCMMISTISGACVPPLMKRLGFDPAQSSSIFLTTVTDIAGFGIFLALGVWLLAS